MKETTKAWLAIAIFFAGIGGLLGWTIRDVVYATEPASLLKLFHCFEESDKPEDKGFWKVVPNYRKSSTAWMCFNLEDYQDSVMKSAAYDLRGNWVEVF